MTLRFLFTNLQQHYEEHPASWFRTSTSITQSIRIIRNESIVAYILRYRSYELVASGTPDW